MKLQSFVTAISMCAIAFLAPLAEAAAVNSTLLVTKRNGWTSVTVTYYGGPDDHAMDPAITGGNCINARTPFKMDRGTVNQIVSSGMYAAPNDLNRDIFGGNPCTPGNPPQCPDQGSCGKCWEIRCRSQFQENKPSAKEFGNLYCNPGKSVVVRIIDACPHNHPLNTNKGVNPCGRGDMIHMDIGHSAFDVIAKRQVGHIWAEMRPVDCGQGLGSKGNGLGSF